MSEISVQLPYQKAVYAALTGDSTLMALVTGVYDNVPQPDDEADPQSVFPYIQIGELTGMPWDTDTCSGQDVTLTIHTWSRHTGKKEMKTIMGHIYRLLQNNRLSSMASDGVTGVVHKIDYENDFIDPDGVTNHGVQRFRALIQGGT